MTYARRRIRRIEITHDGAIVDRDVRGDFGHAGGGIDLDFSDMTTVRPGGADRGFSERVHRMRMAAGEFLRKFDEADRPGALTRSEYAIRVINLRRLEL